MGRDRLIQRTTAFGVCVVLLASACTDSNSEAGSDDNGVVSTSVGETSTTETVELLPYDETVTVPAGPDADDDAEDDLAALEDDGEVADPDEAAVTTTTPVDDGGTTLGSIVPPEDDDVTTTAPPTTVSPDAPVNGDVEQPLQAESAALACATVELGYLQQLGGKNGTDRLDEGAAMAIATGVGNYVTAGQDLADAIDADAGIDSAADALLTQCENDGFERLA